jgi:N-acetyl sugar amidotransferase
MPSRKIIDRQIPILPREIRFCRKCVVSNQRPRIQFDEEGVCSACRYAEIKNNKIDWAAREKELREVCDQYRRKDGRFDIIVPASGGKDSARVAWELKYLYGMHPLTITWAPFEYTPVGYQNFRAFVKVGGFNNLEAWQNGKFHRKLSRVAFEALGDAWQPFTYGQVCYAFHIARAFDVKLVFFGENGEAEYSGDPRVYNLRGMPFEVWAEQYFKGATVDDLIEYGLQETDYFTKDDFDESDLTFYRPPDPDDMRERGIEFHWFAYYKKWTPQENYYLASEHCGFQANPFGRSEGTYSKYASLDDQMDGYHFYLAFMKFGIGRCTSDAAHEIRDGHISREEGAGLVRRFDGEFPKRWFKEFIEYLGITEEHYWQVMDKFRTPHVWRNDSGVWRLNKAVYDEYPSDMDPGYITSLRPENRGKR